MLTPPQIPPGKRSARVVFLDIDGTLVPKRSGEVPERTRRAVTALRARGIRPVLCTGRPVHNVLVIAEQLGLTKGGGWAVTSNGAITGQFTGRRLRPFLVVRKQTFDPRAAFMIAMASYPEAFMAVEEIGEGWLVNTRPEAEHLSGRLRIVHEKKLWAHEVTRAVVRAPGIGALVPAIEGTGFTAYADGPDHIDITKPGLSKRTELEWLRHQWGIDPADTAAAGDGENDIPMLRGVAWGRAMHGAPQPVLDVANAVADPVEQEGIVPWLDSLTQSQTAPRVLPTRTTTVAP